VRYIAGIHEQRNVVRRASRELAPFSVALAPSVEHRSLIRRSTPARRATNEGLWRGHTPVLALPLRCCSAARCNFAVQSRCANPRAIGIQAGKERPLGGWVMQRQCLLCLLVVPLAGDEVSGQRGAESRLSAAILAALTNRNLAYPLCVNQRRDSTLVAWVSTCYTASTV
jgi:hypothetical protein